MIFHIQCLKYILFLFLIMFPSAYIFFLKPVTFCRKSKLIQENISIIIIYSILIVIGILSHLLSFPNIYSDSIWYLFAFMSGFINIIFEYFEAAIPKLIKYKKFPKLFPSSLYSESFSLMGIFSIVCAASLEEIIFRQFMICGLLINLTSSTIIYIFMSAFFYSINHIYFGRLVILQKFIPGLVFSILFIFSEYNIFVPIVAHVTQNIVLYLYSFRRIIKTSPEMKGGKNESD